MYRLTLQSGLEPDALLAKRSPWTTMALMIAASPAAQALAKAANSNMQKAPLQTSAIQFTCQGAFWIFIRVPVGNMAYRFPKLRITAWQHVQSQELNCPDVVYLYAYLVTRK